MSVGLLLVATNKYHQYVDAVTESAHRWFRADGALEVHLMADAPHGGFAWFPVPSLGFPEATLRRYHFITEYADQFEEDWLFYCDVDMLFVAPVGPEVIPRVGNDHLTAVRHPGFWDGGGSWETDTGSTAYVPEDHRQTYYAGGFWGGRRDAVLAMAEDLAGCVDRDAEAGIMAVWHDESHLNRYLSTRNPLALSPSYVYPESWDLPFEPRLLALDKDHAEVRS